MRIARLRIARFRCIREAEIFPSKHNVFLGPNNVGKTAVLEALNLLLNPELTQRADLVDENDFFNRSYRPPPSADVNAEENPTEGGGPETPSVGRVRPHASRPLSEVARLFNRDPDTIRRWVMIGSRGVKLEAISVVCRCQEAT